MTLEDPGKKNAESRKLQQQLSPRGVPSRNHGFKQVTSEKYCKIQEILTRSRYAGANNNYYIVIIVFNNNNNNNNNHYGLGSLRSIHANALPFRRRIPPPPCGFFFLKKEFSVQPNPSFPALDD